MPVTAAPTSATSAKSALPDRARVVVIGGGVIGCSVAYHLAHAGWTDVVVLERDRLTSGTTWHAAGLMTCFGSTSETSTGIRLYSRDLYARLEAETGVSTGFKPVGLIEAAADADRLHEYRRVAAFQRHLGLEVDEISPARDGRPLPLGRRPTTCWPASTCPATAGSTRSTSRSRSPAARKNLGVRVVEGVRVDDVLDRRRRRDRRTALDDGRSTTTATSSASTSSTAPACGRASSARGTALVIPNQAAEHYYLITDTIDGIDPNAPIFEDPASYGYYREEGGGMMVGLFEPRAAAWSVDGIPRDCSFTTLPPDWDRMSPFLEKAMARVPVTLEVGVRTFFCGPESFTPDLTPAVGEAPGIRNYFVAAGMNSVGVLSAGGLGRVLAHWIIAGLPGRRRHRLRRRPLPRRPARAGVPRDAHDRDPRHGVRRAHAGQAAAHRARPTALAGARPAGRARRLPARGVRLGGRRLVRRAGARPPRPSRPGAGRRGSSSGRPSTGPSARASG